MISEEQVFEIQGNTQRKLEVMGENLQIIAKRLLANQDLLRYLYYDDQDPLNPNKSDVTTNMVVGDGGHDEGLIRIVPVIEYKDDSKSILSMRVVKGSSNVNNPEFMEVYFDIRPFLIMSEISKSLSMTEVEGLGTIVWDSFSLNFLTEEMSAYNMMFHFTQFN